MFENVAIRILVGIVIIALGFMVLKFVNADKATTVVEYKAPVDRKKQIVAKLNLPKGILKKTGAPTTQNNVSFAPSAVDATMDPYGAWDTNRNSSSGIMNQLNNYLPYYPDLVPRGIVLNYEQSVLDIQKIV